MSKKTEDTLVQYPSRIDERVAVLENNMIHIKESLDRMEKRFDKIDTRFDNVEKEAKGDFRWLITSIVALAGVMAHGFHWL